jgi:hypothetical protein
MDISKSNLAVEPQSGEKDGANEKTYRIPISTGVFEHCPKMRDALWLFLWYIDKTTHEDEGGKGYILGGMPVVDSKPASALRVPVKTIRRWRAKLVRHGYIHTLRTPYGLVITLLKSKKWNWKPTLVTPTGTDSTGRRDLPIRAVSSLETSRNGKTECPNREHRLPVSGRESAQNGKYKEDRTETLKKQGQNRGQNEEASANRRDELPLEEMRVPHLEAWKKIRLPGPVGSVGFRSGWETWCAEKDSEVDSMVWLMEGYIQDCQSRDVKVPPPFFAAKRNAEQKEREPEDRMASANRRPAVQI